MVSSSPDSENRSEPRPNGETGGPSESDGRSTGALRWSDPVGLRPLSPAAGPSGRSNRLTCRGRGEMEIWGMGEQGLFASRRHHMRWHRLAAVQR